MQNETIVDRVVARLRAQPLGDLITEEDLHDIVKQAIPKVFFENRVIKDGSYHGTKELPPIIVETMRELLQENAKKIVTDWLAANPQVMIDYWKKVCDDNLMKYIQTIQADQATAMLRSCLKPWMEGINNERQRQGLSTFGMIW